MSSLKKKKEDNIDFFSNENKKNVQADQIVL